MSSNVNNTQYGNQHIEIKISSVTPRGPAEDESVWAYHCSPLQTRCVFHNQECRMRFGDDAGGIQVLPGTSQLNSIFKPRSYWSSQVSFQWRNTVQRDARGPPNPRFHINGHPGGIQEHDQECDLKTSETTVSQV